MTATDDSPVVVLEIEHASIVEYLGGENLSTEQPCLVPVRLPISVGRRRDNALMLSDGRISRHAFDIDSEAGQPRLTGITQRRGVFVNGQQIEGGCDLNTDDVITFATVDVRISLRPPASR